ncbi:MAG: hypothetical protein AAF514_17840, partial [Verrucomicrobiota bacterium]
MGRLDIKSSNSNAAYQSTYAVLRDGDVETNTNEDLNGVMGDQRQFAVFSGNLLQFSGGDVEEDVFLVKPEFDALKKAKLLD